MDASPDTHPKCIPGQAVFSARGQGPYGGSYGSWTALHDERDGYFIMVCIPSSHMSAGTSYDCALRTSRRGRANNKARKAIARMQARKRPETKHDTGHVDGEARQRGAHEDVHAQQAHANTKHLSS